jgi:hypothetical protein
MDVTGDLRASGDLRLQSIVFVFVFVFLPEGEDERNQAYIPENAKRCRTKTATVKRYNLTVNEPSHSRATSGCRLGHIGLPPSVLMSSTGSNRHWRPLTVTTAFFSFVAQYHMQYAISLTLMVSPPH